CARFGRNWAEVVTQGRSSCPLREKMDVGGNVGTSIVPGEGEKGMRRSRKIVHRAHYGRNRMEVVTQERSTFPLREKMDGGGHASSFIVPASVEIGWRGSRKSVHRARFVRNWMEVVTQESSSCPLREKMDGVGQASAFIVPTSREIGCRWSRRRVHRARFERKWMESVTRAGSTCPPQ